MGMTKKTSSSPSKKSLARKTSKSKTDLQASQSFLASARQQQQLHLETNLPLCIVDNGGWEIKYGLLPPVDSTPSISATISSAEEHNDSQMSRMFNATARPSHQLTLLVGDEITSRMKNLGQLSWNYPLERGMICDGATQLMVWSRVLSTLGVISVPMLANGGTGIRRTSIPPQSSTITLSGVHSHLSSKHCGFVLLEPPFVPSAISEGVDLILFRELGMGRVAKLLGACMAAVHYLSSLTHNTPGSELKQEVNRVEDAAEHEEEMINKSRPRSEWIDDGTKCCCVVDSGFSFTHVVPTHRGEALNDAIRRLDIGGKVLTNLLKEMVTYRQWNMMDEYHIINDAKEQLCFVSKRFDCEMKEARLTRQGFRWFDREYLLPDFLNTFKGTVQLPAPLRRQRELEEDLQLENELEMQKRGNNIHDIFECSQNEMVLDSVSGELRQDDSNSQKKTRQKCTQVEHDKIQDSKQDENSEESEEETDQQRLQRLKQMREMERNRLDLESLERQVLSISVERFAIPEVLFRPSDIGLECGGVVEAIVEAISACDPILRAAMYNNILLVGGNANIPGFRDRVVHELRKLAPVNYPVRVFLPENPATYAWEGAKQFSSKPGFQQKFTIDRMSWEAMKKAGKDQREIWSEHIVLNKFLHN